VQGPIYQGGFQDVVRLGDTGYSASITAGEVFRPRHNSLLSFNVNQTADGLWLTANPGFDQLACLPTAPPAMDWAARWQPHRSPGQRPEVAARRAAVRRPRCDRTAGRRPAR
jgi:hypothetical protein